MSASAQPDLPHGTVTFLFTDIEGSTGLLKQLGESYAGLLAEHHRLLREIFARNHGIEVDTQGDAFFVSFFQAREAVQAVVTAQKELAAHAWPGGEAVRVRMGLHTGEPWLQEVGYTGMAVHRAARIAQAGHGGQVLMSETTMALVRDDLPQGVGLKDLGAHRLKDMRRPEQIYQLEIPGLPADFPALKALAAVAPLTQRRMIRGYELREWLGEGVWGEVFRAVQPGVGRDVAIKAILPQFANDPEFIRRFEAEAQVIARLEHPHIVPLYDYWRDPEGAYLVMRWLRGGSLQDALAYGPWSGEAVMRLVEQVASALAAAHHKGVVHRDIKPANILLDESGNAYLADFGIATLSGPLEAVLELGQVAGEQVSTGSLGYQSPEVATGGKVTHLADLYSFGVVLYELVTGKRPFPELSAEALIDKHRTTALPSVRELRPELPAAVDEVIQKATAKVPTERYQDALELAADFRGAILGSVALPRQEVLTELANPYKGLRAFQEADEADFYGREALVERSLARLGESGTQARFLAVVGPSGCGKSSLVKAGLIPALRRGALPGSESWYIVEMTPTAHPFEELEASLLRIAVNPPDSLLHQLHEDARGLLRAIKRSLPAEGSQLLLVIDQFEEVFTLVEDDVEARQFLDSLYAAVSEPHSPLRVVLTLRADFYDRPLMVPDFSTLVQDRTEVVVPMTVTELERAIQSPLLRAGVEMEAGLVTTIVADVMEQPGALPLLQYALTELFERRSDHRLTLSEYQALGGVEGVLGKRAEQIYSSLGVKEQALARQAFLRLVALGEGTEDTRRRALIAELRSLSETPLTPAPDPLHGTGEDGKGELDDVLSAFGEARLLTFDRDPLTRAPTVEVAHEALLREWRRLREWLDASRADLRMQRVLANAALDWSQSGGEISFLLRGSRLDQFEAWTATTGLALTQSERSFLDASLADRLTRRLEEQARQERERALERRSRNFLRGLVAVFAAAALVAVALSAFAFTQQRIARQNAEVADQNAATAVAARGEAEELVTLRSRDAQVNQSLALAAQSRLALQANNLDLALALAMEANRIPDPPGQAQMALSEAAYAPGTIRRFFGQAAPIQSVAVSPDGRYGLSGDDTGVILLWDLETGEALRRLEAHSGVIHSLAFSPDGRHAVSASEDQTLKYWDLEKGELVISFAGHTAPVNTAAVSPDGRYVASGSGHYFNVESGNSIGDNSLRLWDLGSGAEVRGFDLFTNSVTDVSFTPDGRRLAVATESDGLVVLDVESGKALARPQVADNSSEIAVSPDGRLALTGDVFGLNRVTVWDMQTGEALKQLEGLTSSVLALAISPDGRRALGGSTTVIEWDLETGEQIHKFNLGANSVAYMPDGRSALIGSSDGTLRLLALESGAEIGRLPAGQGWIRDVAYSPDGRNALANDSFDLFRWDLKTGENIWTAKDVGGFWPIAVSPDGTMVLGGSISSGYLSLWDMVTGKSFKRLEGDGLDPGDLIDAIAFHPGGKFALSGAQGTGADLVYWDVESGTPVRHFDTEAEVLGVAISPDGRTALSAEGDGAVNWWELETGRLIASLKGHTNGVSSVAFLDNLTAISASEDGTLIRWDLENEAAVCRFQGHADGVRRVALSPDQHLALSASRDLSLILWDVQSCEPLRRYTGHSDFVRVVAWHPNGQEALSGGNDFQAIRWRIDADLESLIGWTKQNRFVRELTCDERAAFHIVTPCEGGTTAEVSESLQAVEVTGSALLPPLPVPTSLPAEPASSPVAAQAAEEATWGVNRGSVPAGGVQVWEYAGQAGERLSVRVAADQPANRTWGIERQQQGGFLDPTVAIYSSDGSLLAKSDDLENGVNTDAYLAEIRLPQAGTYRIEVRSYQDQTSGGYRLILGEPRLLVFKAGVPAAAGLALSPDGRTVLVGMGKGINPGDLATTDNRIWIWDLATGEVVQQMGDLIGGEAEPQKQGHAGTPADLAISPDGRQALSAGLDGVAILWNLETGTEMQRLDNQGLPLWNIQFSPDGQTALAISDDGSLVIWDLATGEEKQRLTGHTSWGVDLALSPDGNIAYSTSWDNTLRAWNLVRGEASVYQPFPDGQTNGLAISPDGKRLLVGGGDAFASPVEHQNAVIVMVDASTGQTISTLEGHTAAVNSISVSPDGRYALSGSNDLTVRLWDLTTAASLAVFTGHTDQVFRVAFSPDGLTGYSTSLDGSLRVWDLSDFIGDGGS